MVKGSEEGCKSKLLSIKLVEMLKELYLLTVFKGPKGVDHYLQEPTLEKDFLYTITLYSRS